MGEYYDSASKTLTLPRSFDPAEFEDPILGLLGPDWTTWKGPINGDGRNGDYLVDPRSLKIGRLDINFIEQMSVLKDQGLVNGMDYFQALQRSGRIQLDGRFFIALWLDYWERLKDMFNQSDKAKEKKEKFDCALERIRTKGILYLEFWGQIIRGPTGCPCVSCLRFDSHEQQRNLAAQNKGDVEEDRWVPQIHCIDLKIVDWGANNPATTIAKKV
jgi:hypothetical protein